MAFEITLEEEYNGVVGGEKVYSWSCPLCGDPCPYQRNLLSGYVLSWATSHLMNVHQAEGKCLQAQPRLHVEIDARQLVTLEQYVREATHIHPTSVEALVGQAIEAFIRRTEESK